jgi:type I restriction enzyme M protein
MNMILHNNPTAEIKQNNTLSTPLFLDANNRLKMFDFVVANFPFSFKSWSNGVDPVNDPYQRFQGYGIPPAKNGDYAFLLHIIRSLKSKGKGAVILPHGVLFRGNAEAEIRTNIIRKGYIKGIIGLPANLFYGTGIPACIIVLDKENAENRKGIFMIDASKGFAKDGNKNRLREQDIHKIVDVFNKQIEVPKYSRVVSVTEIEEKEFNLNIPRYIDSQEAEDIQDIEAHLKGGIPDADIEALEQYWNVYPTLKKQLFSKSDRKGYSTIKVTDDAIKQTIFAHPEFTAYSQKVDAVFINWKNKNTPILKKIDAKTKPKKFIHQFSEELLQTFLNLQLIDNYDVYQHLMTYWNETMQDDFYLIISDGWKAGNDIEWNKKEFEGRLIPKKFLTNRYFAAEQKAIEQLEADRDALVAQMEEMEEEHSGEEGYFAELEKVNKASVAELIKEIQSESKQSDETKEELAVLNRYLELNEQVAEANKKVKDAQSALNDKLVTKYKILTENEIKTLVIDDKWMAALEQDVKSEMQRINQRLTQRIKELSDRYALPLPMVSSDVESLEKKVNVHLQKMGFVWK